MAQKRVLVVEGKADNLAVFHELLTLWGYDVEATEDGKKGVAAALARRPDVVLLDLGLADSDAFTVIRRIKAADSRIVVVVFTAWHDLEATARTAGADRFVLKPDLDALERLLRCLGPVSRSASASLAKKGHARGH